eukprot:6099484-Pyramimonas_sp.AAC.1
MRFWPRYSQPEPHQDRPGCAWAAGEWAEAPAAPTYARAEQTYHHSLWQQREQLTILARSEQ